ncbi:MAG: 30S ribosomal protein S16 [Planctomycetota bacterium]
MAVRIRCKRMGRRNRPFFRIGVFDGRTRRDGRSIEDLGFYDPRAAGKQEPQRLDTERALYWLNHGAQASETVASILKKLGVKRTVISQRVRRPKPGKGPRVTAAPKTKLGKKARKALKAAQKAAQQTEGARPS